MLLKQNENFYLKFEMQKNSDYPIVYSYTQFYLKNRVLDEQDYNSYGNIRMEGHLIQFYDEWF